MKTLFPILLISLLLANCKSSKNKIDKLIHSEGACDRIEGYELIGRYKDTSYLRELFENPNDIKICHSLSYYGKSPLWAKVRALEKITSLKLPYDYNSFTLDTTALLFYKKVLLKQGYIIK